MNDRDVVGYRGGMDVKNIVEMNHREVVIVLNVEGSHKYNGKK